MENETIIAFTDGSAINNGKSNCRAGIGVWFPDFPEEYISAPIIGPRESNIRAELFAIRECLRKVEFTIIPKLISTKNKNKNNNQTLIIYTDSLYSINALTIWAKKWERNDWRKADGAKVINLKLIQSIYNNINNYPIKIEFKYVRGHQKKPNCDPKESEYKVWEGNAKADKLAKNATELPRN